MQNIAVHFSTSQPQIFKLLRLADIFCCCLPLVLSVLMCSAGWPGPAVFRNFRGFQRSFAVFLEEKTAKNPANSIFLSVLFAVFFPPCPCYLRFLAICLRFFEPFSWPPCTKVAFHRPRWLLLNGRGL